jgi:hypothetical protein
MTIINRFFLKMALLPAGVYRGMGVNTVQLKSILVTKLTMDDRRPGTLQQTRKRRSAKPVTMATVGTMAVSLVIGLVYLLSFLVGQDIVTNLTVYFSLFFFMLSASMISDFTSVLIDVRDNYIILPKPVSGRTFVVARLLHIFIHICKIVIPMSLPGLVNMIASYGVAGGIIFLVVVLLVTLFAIFFINAVYLVILKITTPERFQSIISYIQIIFAIVIYASYQVFPRMISDLNMQEFNIADYPAARLYPMYWFANSWDVVYHLKGSTMAVWLALAGLIVPLFSLYVVVKYLAPSFNNKLAMISMSAASAGPSSGSVATGRRRRGVYSAFLSKVLTRGFAERMGFLFTWKMTSRSRDFKMRVYPSIGYLVVYIVVMFMNNRDLNIHKIAEQGTTGRAIIISALYFTSLLLTMAIGQIRFSEKFKASWIYHVSPIEKPGEVILGATKAAIFKFYIPLVFFITITGMIIVGPSVLPNIILGLFNELLIATILVYMGNKLFPFSQHQDTARKTGGFLRGIMVLFISGLIALGHFLIYNILPAVLLCVVMSVIATWLMMGSIRNISWTDIRSSYTEE